jgi:hypothetical protein
VPAFVAANLDERLLDRTIKKGPTATEGRDIGLL